MDPALLLFAFSAGAAAFFAPCCVAMLPAYVAYAVRGPEDETLTRLRPRLGPRYAAATTRVPRVFAILGGLTLVVGSVPIIVTSLQTFTEIPYDALLLMPSIDASLVIVLVGALLLLAALVMSGRARQAARGALFGTFATMGFLVVFIAIGLPIALLARALAAYLPVLAILVGATLVILGALMLAGKHIVPRLPTFGTDPATRKGFVLFGAGYGLASLSCTFPIFLAVMAAGLLAGGITSAVAVFAAYALGKATLLVAITAVTVAGGDAARAKLGRVTPHITRAAAVLLIASGVYLAYYYGRFAVIL